MYTLYDTSKELFYADYKKLPDLYSLNCTELQDLRQNMYDALENAMMYGSSLLEIALSDDIVKLQKHMCFQWIYQTSPGHIAKVIGSTSYDDIDLLCHAAHMYFNSYCTDEKFIQIGTHDTGIEKLARKAYKAAKIAAKAMA